MIGDVGYLDVGTGNFNYLFNIYFDAKHHAGSPIVIPDNFVPIQPPFEDWEVKVSPDYFAKGTIITSEGVNVNRTPEDDLYVVVSVLKFAKHLTEVSHSLPLSRKEPSWSFQKAAHERILS